MKFTSFGLKIFVMGFKLKETVFLLSLLSSLRITKFLDYALSNNVYFRHF